MLTLYFEDQHVEIGDAPIIAPIDAAVEQGSQRGSHIKLRTRRGVGVVSNHAEIARDTLRWILRQADLTLQEFEKLR